MEQQPQQHLDGQSEHGEEEGHQDRILQQAHALVVFGVVTPEESVDQQTAHDKKAADYNGAENAFAPIRSDAENVRQVDVDLIDEAVVIPRLPGPEPLPAGSANEGADEDHRDPQNNEAEQERADGELALLPGVVAGAQRIRIYIRNDHQTEDDERGHDHAGDPRVEINQHFLQAKEIPRRLRRVHGQVGIRRFFERRIQSDGPDHQDDGDDDGGQEFHAQQKRPDVHFFGPPGLERPRLAMMRFGQRRIPRELLDQDVIGVRLFP